MPLYQTMLQYCRLGPEHTNWWWQLLCNDGWILQSTARFGWLVKIGQSQEDA